MAIKATLRLINQMQRDGVIGRYAIGGAVGAMAYLEPFATQDIDVFVVMPISRDSGLIDLRSIYGYLLRHGATAEDSYIRIADWLVQFIPPANDLELEALDRAVQITLERVRTRVMTAEHLVAICLQTGRAKDLARIVSFLQHKAVSPAKLRRVLSRHGLEAKWEKLVRDWGHEASQRVRNPTSDMKLRRRQALSRLPFTKKVPIIEELRDFGASMRKARRTLR